MAQQVGATATITCTVCLDNDIISAQTIGKDPICQECITTEIVPRFAAALEHEHLYPVRFGEVALQVKDFAHVLGDDFVKRYHRRELEYQTPVANRIYCQHKLRAANTPPKGALGPKGGRLALLPYEIDGLKLFGADVVECGAMVSGRVQRSNTKLICYHCHGDVCACEKPLQSPTEVHDCIAKRKAGLGLEAEGQVRGKDFQLCPSCNVPVFLGEGCNAMTHVPCRTQFCFICGEIAHHNSNHWQLGSNCPRWGQPGPRAMFDRNDHEARNAANDPNAFQIPDPLQAVLRVMDMINEIREAGREDIGPLMPEEIAFPQAPIPQLDRILAIIREREALFVEWGQQQAELGAANQDNAADQNEADGWL